MNGRTPLDSEEVVSVKKMVAGFASPVLKLTELHRLCFKLTLFNTQ